MSETSSSSPSICHQNEVMIKNTEEALESRKKVKKMRSIKLGKLPSLKIITTTRQGKSQSDHFFKSPLVNVSVSPNYMKNTSSSDARKDIFQKPGRTLTRRSSFKPAKSLMRLTSTKHRRSLKSRSIKLRNRNVIVRTRDSDALHNHLKTAEFSDEENMQCQESSDDSESGLSSNNQNPRSLSQNSASGRMSMGVIGRTSSFRPTRMLRKVASLRTKRSSVKKSSRMLDRSIPKATCSSTLKDSKMAANVVVEPGTSETEGVKAMKVCPYSYCSLHGHKHADVPPLKRFISMRRRMLKTQKSFKVEKTSVNRGKRPSNTKKDIRSGEMDGQRDAGGQETAKKSRAVTFIGRQMARSKVSVAEECSDGGEDEGTIQSKNDIKIAPHRSSDPHLGLEDDSEVSKLSTEEEKVVPTFVSETETSAEFSPQHKEEEITMSDSRKFAFTVEPPGNVECSWQKLVTTEQCRMMHFDEYTGLNHEEISADGDEITNLNMDVLEDDSECENERLNVFVDSKAINSAATPSSDELREEQDADKQDKDEESSTDSDPDCETEVESTGMEKQHSIGLWHLIYQQMVRGIAEGDESQPTLDKTNKEDDGDDAKMSAETNRSGSCSDSKDVEDHDRGSPDIQFYQRSAIKLVQEAFDKILSEVPDQSADDKSVSSCTTLDKEMAENTQDGGRELSNSTSSSSGTFSTVQEQDGIHFAATEINDSEREKVESKLGSISNQQTSKNWSNLKKKLLLTKFVKALEKVKNIKTLKPRHLPLQPGPESEKINLRHQVIGEKKSSEEWMLDYALRKVVSTLAPAQKRKVALLVQAFEAVGPFPESGTNLRSDIAISLSANPIANSTASSSQMGTKSETNFGILLRKTSRPDLSSEVDKAQVCDFSERKEHILESFSDHVEQCLESSCINAELSDSISEFTASGFRENFETPSHDDANHSSAVKNDRQDYSMNCSQDPENQGPTKVADVTDSYDNDVQQEELVSNSKIVASDENSGDRKSQSSEILEGSVDISNASKSVPVTEMVNESSKATDVKILLQNKFLKALESNEESPSSSADVAQGKRKNMKLWFMIYQHMVSGSAAELDEADDKEEQRKQTNTSFGNLDDIPHQEYAARSRDAVAENCNEDNENVEMQQLEAIRMVEEAIDEISLPDSQDDSPDDQSVIKGIIPNHEQTERQLGGYVSISTAIGFTREGNGESDSTKVEQIAAELNEQNKPKLPPQRSWSNLKKVIILKKFVKAMENVKKFNPRGPRFLPLEHENGPEKVHLRHQEIEDRKKADEWMLDYALQQVVAKLTPARKRKVELLVEAFETVVPALQVKK